MTWGGPTSPISQSLGPVKPWGRRMTARRVAGGDKKLEWNLSCGSPAPDAFRAAFEIELAKPRYHFTTDYVHWRRRKERAA